MAATASDPSISVQIRVLPGTGTAYHNWHRWDSVIMSPKTNFDSTCIYKRSLKLAHSHTPNTDEMMSPKSRQNTNFDSACPLTLDIKRLKLSLNI